MADKNVHGGHRKRLRDRAAAEGLDGFDPHQVLELMLFYAIPRQDTSEHAHRLIDRFGSVYAVLTAPPEELMEVPGIGKRAAEWLNKLGALVDAYGDLRLVDRPQIANFKQAGRFVSGRMKKCVSPGAYYACLTAGGVVQVFAQLSSSDEWCSPAGMKQCIDDVLSVHAKNVIIFLLVEDENPTIGEYDCNGAQQFCVILAGLNAALVDVVLVGRQSMVSMRVENKYNPKKYGIEGSRLMDLYMREDPDWDGEDWLFLDEDEP